MTIHSVVFAVKLLTDRQTNRRHSTMCLADVMNHINQQQNSGNGRIFSELLTNSDYC